MSDSIDNLKATVEELETANYDYLKEIQNFKVELSSKDAEIRRLENRLTKYADKKQETDTKAADIKKLAQDEYKIIEDILQQTSLSANHYKTYSIKLEKTLKESIESLLLHSEFDFSYLDESTEDEEKNFEVLKSSITKIKKKAARKTSLLLEELLEDSSHQELKTENLNKIYKKLLSHLKEVDLNSISYDLSAICSTPRKSEFVESNTMEACNLQNSYTLQRNNTGQKKDSGSEQQELNVKDQNRRNRESSKSAWDLEHIKQQLQSK